MSRRRFDLAAAVLFAALLLTALAVFSHDPADTPGNVYPPRPDAANLLGVPGAWLAAALVDALGLAVHALLAGWFVFVLLLLLRRDLVTWSLRLAGWLVLLPASAVLTDTLDTALGTGNSGSGGTLGAWLAVELEHALEPPGRWLLLGGCLLVGTVLAFDFALGAVASVGLRGLTWACHLFRWLLLPVLDGRAEVAVALPEEDERPVRVVPAPRIAPSSSEPTIPIHHAQAPAVDPVLIEAAADYTEYELPPLTLLEDPKPFPFQEKEQLLRDRAALLEKTFGDFSLHVRVVGIHTGPVITQYEIALETGLRVNKVTALADDLALNLGVPNVRIVAPILGKTTVGIEVPNEHRAVVSIKEVMLAAGFMPGGRTGFAAKAKLPLFLGKDVEGKPIAYDLADMPHLLIAGTTGTGKSVCLNALVLSILMTRRPDEVKLILIDPKMLELSEYGKVPHLMHPVVKDMDKAEAILSWAVDKMEERYDILSRARVRNIAGYNQLEPAEIHRRVKPADDEERKRIPDHMPYVIIIIDEVGDLIMQKKKEVEGHIIRLAQKSRAAGIHLILATQKPTVDVITGLIKSNLPARICFQVASRTDSRVVLDAMGADKLLGKGDMLFLQPGTSTLVRAQGTYASNEEIERVVGSLECDKPCYAEELMRLNTSRLGESGFLESLRARDELYEPAIEVVVREGRGSVSLLQRSLSIGYGRAARLIDFMAEDGIVGAYNGSNARDVLYSPEEWDKLKQGDSLKESA